MYKIAFFLMATLISFSAHSGVCTTIGHQDGKQHHFKSMLNNFTHIILPENIKQGTKPIVGNKTLWDTDSAGPHIFIKPNSQLKPGMSTSLSAVGESGKSYDFKISRSASVESTCYKLTEGVLFTDKERGAYKKQRDISDSGELAGLWKDKYMQAKQNMEESTHQAVMEALRRYRYQIYTRYNWKKSKKHRNYKKRKDSEGFIGSDFVSDVYDDGRFTYIRVYNQNKGIMMVEAALEGQTEIIEAKFDSMNRMYTISGIFPEFTLKYGKSKLKVYRADNSTVGEY